MPDFTIECDGCGRSFRTEDPGMLGAIKGPCPTCGGTFRLADVAAPQAPAPGRSA